MGRGSGRDDALVRGVSRRSGAARQTRARVLATQASGGTCRRCQRRAARCAGRRGGDVRPRADHRAGGAESSAAGHRGDAPRIVAAPGPPRRDRRPQEGAGARAADHADHRRRDARIHPGGWFRGPPRPDRHGPGRRPRRRVPDGDVEPGRVLRARHRDRLDRARALRRRAPAARSERASSGEGDRARPLAAQDGRLLARIPEPPWSRVFTSPAPRLDVHWRVSADDFRLPRRDRYRSCASSAR